MALSATVRRGVEIPDNTIITAAILRQLGLPTVLIEGDVGSATIADGSITEGKLANGAVTNAKLGSNAVQESNIANGAVTSDKLAAGVFTSDTSKPGPYWYGPGVYTVGTGTYAVTLTVAPASLAAGLTIKFLPDATNTGTSGAVNLNVNSLGSKDLLKAGGQELAPGDIRSGKPVEAIYDGTQFILISNPANQDGTPFATTDGTSTAYTVSLAATTFPPLGALYPGARLRVKFHVESGATPTLAVDGMTAKQIRSPGDAALAAGALLINSAYELIYDPAANSAAGAWVIVSGTLCSGLLSAPNPTTGNLSVSFAHGLGRTPRSVRVVLVRVASGTDPSFTGAYDFSIAQYDEIEVWGTSMLWGDNYHAFQIKCNATNVVVLQGSNSANAGPYLYYEAGGNGSNAIWAYLANSETYTDAYRLKVYYE